MITISGPLKELVYNEELQEKIREIEDMYPASIHGTDTDVRPMITTYYIGEENEVYPRTTYETLKINDYNYDESDIINGIIADILSEMQEAYPLWQRTRYNLTTYIREQHEKDNLSRKDAEELLILNGLTYQQVSDVLPELSALDELHEMCKEEPAICRCKWYTKRDELCAIISEIYNLPSESSVSIIKAMDLLFKDKEEG